ncbi:hypothetical protein LPJ63_000476 [Coemansia sp. RSA 2711]|nr:hypothetical protein LPJ63_000476 [Coemansia sp. RSA 2711]
MVHRIECGNYSIERIPYEEETQKLDTEDVYIAQIAPTQTARILQFIGKTLPKLDGIEHVKRKVEELKKQGTEDNGRAVAVIMGSAQTHKIVAKATDTAAKSGNPLDHAFQLLKLLKIR